MMLYALTAAIVLSRTMPSLSRFSRLSYGTSQKLNPVSNHLQTGTPRYGIVSAIASQSVRTRPVNPSVRTRPAESFVRARPVNPSVRIPPAENDLIEQLKENLAVGDLRMLLSAEETAQLIRQYPEFREKARTSFFSRPGDPKYIEPQHVINQELFSTVENFRDLSTQQQQHFIDYIRQGTYINTHMMPYQFYNFVDLVLRSDSELLKKFIFDDYIIPELYASPEGIEFLEYQISRLQTQQNVDKLNNQLLEEFIFVERQLEVYEQVEAVLMQ